MQYIHSDTRRLPKLRTLHGTRSREFKHQIKTLQSLTQVLTLHIITDIYQEIWGQQYG